MICPYRSGGQIVDLHMAPRRPYRSDLSDARWALIEPTLTAWRAARRGPGTAARIHDLREIVNAILYVCRTGIAWEYLPHDFPPYKTVYDYYAKWEADGTTQRLHDLLREQVRESKGRAAVPTAAIIDAQSVKPPATSASPARASMPARRSRAESGTSPRTPWGCCWRCW
jgi:transposase